MRTAVVRFDGAGVRATPIRQTAAGDWIMSSLQHAARLTVGTEFFVPAGDVLHMDKDEATIGRPDHGLTTLEAALRKEREALPTPVEIIKGNPPIAHDAPNKVEG